MLLQRLIAAYPRMHAATPALALVLSCCLPGCAAMIQDVHLYYQQMAINYKEAEEKAKLDAVTLERESASLLQGGEMHKYNRAQREIAKIKNWQEYCARQHRAIPESRRENGRARRYQERCRPGQRKPADPR